MTYWLHALFCTVVVTVAVEIWAAAGFVDTSLSFSSFFELYRTDVPKRRVPPRWVVERRCCITLREDEPSLTQGAVMPHAQSQAFPRW